MPAASSASAPPVLERGDVVAGAYRIEARIGGGGMGAVYRARRIRDDRAVALKVVREHAPDLVARLEREARITGSIDHPNMVRVHDVVRDEGGAPVVVMELLHGETLGQRLARERVLPVAEVARIALGILGALEAAHARAVVHRDLKPDNVFLTSVDGKPFVKVLDFGIAKAIEGASVIDGLATLETRSGHIIGTPQYMAPEQIFGEKDVDYRADLWALGVVLYEALAGQRPFDGENVGQVFKAIALDPPVPLAERRVGLPRALLTIVAQLLAHARAERPASLADVRAALAPLVDDTMTLIDAGTAATVEVTSAARATTSRKGARGWVLGGVVFASVTGAAVWLASPPAPVASAAAPTAAIDPARVPEKAVPEAPSAVATLGRPATLSAASPSSARARPATTAAAPASAPPPPPPPPAASHGPRSGPLHRDEF